MLLIQFTERSIFYCLNACRGKQNAFTFLLITRVYLGMQREDSPSLFHVFSGTWGRNEAGNEAEGGGKQSRPSAGAGLGICVRAPAGHSCQGVSSEGTQLLSGSALLVSVAATESSSHN